MYVRLVPTLILALSLGVQVCSETPAEWKARRTEFTSHLGPKSIAVFKSAKPALRSNDVEYPFRQESNFYYLTGMKEENAMLLLVPSGIEIEGQNHRVQEILFVAVPHPHKAIWSGERLRPEAAKEQLGFEVVLNNSQFDHYFDRALAHADTVYMKSANDKPHGYLSDDGDSVNGALEQLLDITIMSPTRILAGMREIKSTAELETMQRAIEVTCAAHRELMRSARTGMTELELRAIIEYVFHNGGSKSVAFQSIVGSGPNACILHYRAGQRTTQAGDLVVVDIGAEIDMYAADVTRTIPISGQFTEVQAKLYELVLQAQEAAIAKVKPGIGFREPGEEAIRVITQGLIDLKILTGSLEQNIIDRKYRDFFMHGASHYLGLDVHDTGTYGVLRPGVVITIEPGIYISEQTAKKYDLPSEYANIGIRIEDDILVTETGHENLSSSVPRTIEEIEALMAVQGYFEREQAF